MFVGVKGLLVLRVWEYYEEFGISHIIFISMWSMIFVWDMVLVC